MLDRLESRRLLSSSLTGGVLEILATAASDVISVNFNGSAVVVVENGSQRVFPSASAPQVSAQLLGGNDSFTLGTGMTGTATILGGDGNDTITCRAGQSSVRGGAGNDTIRIALGTANGDGGRDLMIGTGPATLIGSSGNDTFRSEAMLQSEAPMVSYFKSKSPLTATIDGIRNDGVAGESDNIESGVGGIIGTPFNDTMTGSDRDETLRGGAGTDDMFGGGGSDTADYSDHKQAVRVCLDGERDNGNPGENDFVAIDIENILGGPGNDTLIGNDGENLIDGGLGADDMIGKAGTDIVTYARYGPGQPIVVTMDRKMNDGLSIPGFREYDNVHGDIEVVIGGDGNDRIVAGPTREVAFVGGRGSDTLIGGPGDDRLDGGEDADSISGGPGNDIIINQSDTGGPADTLDGGSNFDFAQDDPTDVFTNVEFTFDFIEPPPYDSGGSGNNFRVQALALAATATADIVDGALSITGTDGNDTIAVSQSRTGLTVSINGRTFPSVLLSSIPNGINVDSGSGNDRVDLFANLARPVLVQSFLRGGDGNDVLLGGDGPDAIFGGRGNDSCLGRGGADVINGGATNIGGGFDGTDTLDGGSGGVDVVDYSARTADLSLNIDGMRNDGAAGENDFIGRDIERILGGMGNDLIVGNEKDNLLAGGRGRDTMRGGDGVDVLVANARADQALGDAAGRDSVFGEGGNDILVLNDLTRDDFDDGPGFDTGNLDRRLSVTAASDGVDFNLINGLFV